MSETTQVCQNLTLREIKEDKDILALHIVRIEARLPNALAPTHLFERDGQVVGYASVAAIPILMGWLHDDRITSAEARACFEAAERQAAEQGYKYLVMPCTDDCRFIKEARQMGWRPLKKATMFLKFLK